MNKQLFEKVKGLCKDTGLSEKYLKAITEALGGSIEDDSTDEKAIGDTANLVAKIAVETQGEATRWATKPKDEPKPKNDPKPDPEPKPKDEPKGSDTALEARIKALEEALAESKAKESKAARKGMITAAMEKHKIPAKFRDRLAASIADDEDVEEAVAEMKQSFITAGLLRNDTEGAKGASEKQVDETADALLESITAK